MRKIAFVDFDRVLFDVDEFKKETFYPFVDHNRLPKLPEEFTFQEALQTQYWLAKVDLKKFIFEDAINFLRLLKQCGYERQILTFGAVWIQSSKIESSSLIKYVDGYTVTSKPDKARAIEGLCNPEVDDIVLFDDSLRAIDAVKKNFPKVFAVQVLRRDEDLKKSVPIADAVVRNLEEATRAVLSRPR